MPTYEYRCRDCGDHLEVHQAFTDDPLTECPSCGGSLRKKFGNVGISFKGSGFYKNDSRSTSSSTAGGTSSGKGESGSADAGGADKSASDKGSSDTGSSDTSATPAPSTAATT